jgi:hypothetical protein
VLFIELFEELPFDRSPNVKPTIASFIVLIVLPTVFLTVLNDSNEFIDDLLELTLFGFAFSGRRPESRNKFGTFCMYAENDCVLLE